MAKLGGQVVTPGRQQEPPFWVWNGGLKQLYMSSYHLAPKLIEHYLDALVEHRRRDLVAARAQLAERERAVAQLPEHAQRPAPAEQVERGHNRPAAARAAHGS